MARTGSSHGSSVANTTVHGSGGLEYLPWVRIRLALDQPEIYTK